MAKLAMPYIFLFRLSYIISIYKVIGAIGTKQVSTKSAMMSSSNN
jgi:hypothetical protein